MRIVQKISLNQRFIVTMFHLFFQFFEHCKLFQMHPRFFIIVKPTVKYINPIHQPLWVRCVICLTESEFKVIDSRQYGFLINSLIHNFLQCIMNDVQKTFLIGSIGILRNDLEIRLQNSVFIRPFYIFSNLCIQKRLLYRGTRSIQKGIFQNRKCYIEFDVKCRTCHHIIRKIRVICFFLMFQNRVRKCHILCFPKWLLKLNSGIHLYGIKFTQIFPVQPIQFLFHIHISIQVDITIRRMVIFPVEIQKFFIA